MIPEEKLIELDNLIDEKMSVYDFLLPFKDSISFKRFIRHFLYVVKDFMCDSDKKSLFIRIPVQEFANLRTGQNSKLQIQRFADFTDALISCLELFTSSEQLKKLIVPDHKDYPGDWYHDDEFYLYLSETDEYILSPTQKNGKSLLKFFKARPPQPSFTTGHKKDLLKNGHVYRLACSETPSQIGSTISSSKMRVESIQENKEFCQIHNFPTYHSITYCGLTSYNSSDNRFIPSLVKRCGSKWDDLINNWSSELLVMMGDSTYLKNAQSIQNRLKSNELDKVLFIGTESPWKDIDTYNFTVQEMNRYCIHNGGNFHEIKYKKLTFPWMSDTVESLSALLSQYQGSISENAVVRLTRFLVAILSDARFSNDFLAEYQREDNDYVNDTFDEILQDVTDPAIYDNIVLWFRSLTYDGENPKKVFSDHNKNRLCVYRSSYKRKVSALEGVNNKIIVDIPVYLNRDDNVIKYILKNHLFADITIMYYAGFEDIVKEYLNASIYLDEREASGVLRHQLGTSLDSGVDTSINSNYEDLIDYYVPDFYDNMYLSPNEADHTIYTVEFQDGMQVDLSGDALVSNDGKFVLTTFPDLFKKESKGVGLAYYQTPENFTDLVCSYANFPAGRNIESLSCLWKNNFYDYVQDKQKGGLAKDVVLADISHASGIPVNRLKPYATINGGGLFMHPREMKLMVNYMLSENLLNKEDAHYVLAARNFTSTFNNSFGRRLKKGLLQYLSTEEISAELNDILGKCNVSVDDLVYSCIHQGIINDIYISICTN